MKLAKTFFIGLALAAISSSVFASGGFGGGGFGERPRAERQVDPTYEHGKALIKSRIRDYGKIKYCVTAPGSSDGGKVKGRSLKPYKNGDANELANNLYNCDDPEQKIAELLVRDDLIAVLYYLNKRYKLNLSA